MMDTRGIEIVPCRIVPQVLFNIEFYDSMGLFSPNSGLKLYLTPAEWKNESGGMFVDWNSGINLSPGFDHSITVHPKTMSKLSHPYSDCEFYRKGKMWMFNTKEQCQAECQLE